MNSFVSVVTSVYNGEKYLRESVESILNQTFTDFEFIIINDGSTDKTKNILEEYAAKDKRVILIHQDNVGLTKSLNNGIAIANGKYIARQDVDDISKPERFEKQLAFMDANPAVGLLSSRFEFITEKQNDAAKLRQTTERLMRIENTLKEAENALKTKEHQTEQLCTELHNAKLAVESKNDRLNENHNDLIATQQECNNNRIVIERLKNDVKRLEEMINALLTSKSWKMTTPVRRIYDMLKAKRSEQ